MRTLAKIMLTTALALTVSSSASAIVSVTLTQIGGTYDGSAASAAGTLVLDIGYDITGASVASLIDPAIALNGAATLITGSETSFAAWSNGSGSITPIATGDIADKGGYLDGWEKSTLAASVGPACVFGDCTSLGTVTLQLTGLGGVIDLGGVLSPTPFGTIIADQTTNITASSFLGTFTVVAVPEPTTASLLGLGLLGLTLAGRSRKN